MNDKIIKGQQISFFAILIYMGFFSNIGAEEKRIFYALISVLCVPLALARNPTQK